MAGEEETAGSTVAGWASAGIGLGNVFLRAARNLGRRISPSFLRGGTHLSNGASLLGVAYDVYREDGLGHKSERAASGIASTGVNMALGGAAATAGESAALTGAIGASGATVVTVAAPVVLSAAAAGATAKAADLAIENRRAYEELDRDTSRDAAPLKIRERSPGDKPSILDYKHLAAIRSITAHMRDGALHTSGPIARFEGGVIRDLSAIDFTDPTNLAEYERALYLEIEKQKSTVEANDSVLPRWLRHGDSINRYNFASGELENLRGAQAEFAMFREDVRRYTERMANSAGRAEPLSSNLPRDQRATATPAFSTAAVEPAANIDTEASPGPAVSHRHTAKPFAPG